MYCICCGNVAFYFRLTKLATKSGGYYYVERDRSETGAYVVANRILNVFLTMLAWIVLPVQFVTSLCLVMLYTVGFVWALFCWEYSDLGDFFYVVFEG